MVLIAGGLVVLTAAAALGLHWHRRVVLEARVLEMFIGAEAIHLSEIALRLNSVGVLLSREELTDALMRLATRRDVTIVPGPNGYARYKRTERYA